MTPRTRENAPNSLLEVPAMSSITRSATHTTITTVNTNTTPESHVPSIRSLMIEGILMNIPKATIRSAVERHHPMAAGATKFAKHLAWYRADLKKKGLLPEQNVEATEDGAAMMD